MFVDHRMPYGELMWTVDRPLTGGLLDRPATSPHPFPRRCSRRRSRAARPPGEPTGA